MKKILLCLCALTILVAAVSSCEDTPKDSPKGSDTETTALPSSAGGSEDPEKTTAESTSATPDQSTDSPENTTDRSPIELPVIPDK